MLNDVVGFLAQEHAGEAATSTPHTPAPPPEVLFHVAGWPITNTVVTMWLVMLILVLFAWLGTRNRSTHPTGLQNFWEFIVELWSGVARQNMGEHRARRFLPLIMTAFLFILFSNWIGTLPISYIMVMNDEHHLVPLFRSANSDLNLTAAMAILMIVLAEFFELRAMGGLSYLKGLIVPNPMRWIEIFTRPLSLSFRLFGNIFAGEVLLITMLGVAPFVMFVFLALELFVGLIQALIFSMLSLVFLSIATMHEEGHGHEHHDEHEAATQHEVEAAAEARA
jgi:F-type H+-transporting ATPase subunit a